MTEQASLACLLTY